MIEFIDKTEDRAAVAVTTLTLPLDLRQKSRQRVELDNGQEAAVILKRGTVLHNNDMLIATDKTVIRVQAANELLSAARCNDPLLFARACYHLGNRHMPLQIESGRIVYLHDHVLDDMLRGLGLEVEQVSEPFEPEAGAYGGSADNAGHHHGH
ncbi:urease accessory protein UreE [Desulfosediminicola flagellatus]|uniref:urease accessory protein UreE n=1 Tax=Desulfosediminicola flagellatus TaxID=2569541 RepID=UPI0010AD0C08|nr:urease accessory protein UreE [Desulfosediminicola flagellatus]